MTHLWIDFGISVTGTIDWCRLQTPVEVGGRLGLWKPSPTLLGALAGQIATMPWTLQ